jgi:hypothetical protein
VVNSRLNRAIVSLLILFLLGSSLPAAGSAATNQNLEWGVEVGNRFDYHFQSNEMESNCYLIVESLPAIQDDISEIDYLDFFNVTPGYTLYFVNGTIAWWWMFDLTQLIIPSGNWNLWSSLVENRYGAGSINITETSTSWMWTSVSQQHGASMLIISATFQKSNGVLSYYGITHFTSEGDEDFVYRITGTTIFITIGPYLLAIVYIVALMAVVILYKKKL